MEATSLGIRHVVWFCTRRSQEHGVPSGNIKDKSTQVGRLAKACEVEVMEAETCSGCVLPFRGGVSLEVCSGCVLSFRGGVSWRCVRKCGRKPSLVGWDLLRVSSLGHWVVLLISGFLLFKWALTLTS